MAQLPVEPDTRVSYEDCLPYQPVLQRAGLLQYLALWRDGRTRADDPLLWGDEVEYTLLHVDKDTGMTRLNCRLRTLVAELNEAAAADHPQGDSPRSIWHYEGGRYMVEGTPGSPYGDTFTDLLAVEGNLRCRRRLLESLCHSDEACVTLTTFPRLGASDFMIPSGVLPSQLTGSHTIPDLAITDHLRYHQITENAAKRCGTTCILWAPIYRDLRTPINFIDPLPATITPENLRRLYHIHPPGPRDCVYLDSLYYGFGSCSLQATVQMPNLARARYLYDQLSVLAPVLLSLTAAAPATKGYLLETDTRWHFLRSAGDDRRLDEMIGTASRDSPTTAPFRPRYDSITNYLGTDNDDAADSVAPYNDVPVRYDPDHYATCRQAGLDHWYSVHLASIFTRDLMSGRREFFHGQDAPGATGLSDTFTASVWPTTKLKPPCPRTGAGWRVECRPMELQYTDSQNAALAVFVVLLARAILHDEPNFYVPISHLDDNMVRAARRAAVRQETFSFRTGQDHEGAPVYERLSVNEIINGQSGGFTGLLPLIHTYLDGQNLEAVTRTKINRHLALVGDRASGKLPTCAEWMRSFIQHHPQYHQDSIVSAPINHDLMMAILQDNGDSATTAFETAE
ncbi:glutamate--cysteine ligase [Tieghemiomyces parasiticus]|uniref:Glutamate--cysteine ligase n=1 Tax=Tieghemiomyces parasiticus TaxID=78921 RepID=A0A9W8ADN6_9FUNG|nr:glutamate--cysteine ligase [Tieghemiomyces parasiticus]